MTLTDTKITTPRCVLCDAPLALSDWHESEGHTLGALLICDNHDDTELKSLGIVDEAEGFRGRARLYSHALTAPVQNVLCLEDSGLLLTIALLFGDGHLVVLGPSAGGPLVVDLPRSSRFADSPRGVKSALDSNPQGPVARMAEQVVGRSLTSVMLCRGPTGQEATELRFDGGISFVVYCPDEFATDARTLHVHGPSGPS